MKNETRKRCPCGDSFVAISSGGIKLTDGTHCVECTMRIRLEAARNKVLSCRDEVE